MYHSDSEYGSDEDFQIDSLRKLQDDLNNQKSPDRNIKASPRFLKTIGKEKSMKMPKITGFKGSYEKRGTPKRSKSEMEVHRTSQPSEELSVGEDDNFHFSPNYFIHDYSSDTDDGSVRS